MTDCPECDCPLERYGCHNECKRPAEESKESLAAVLSGLTAEMREYRECVRRADEEAATINWPPHYNHSNIQPIDVIEAWELDHHTASVVKYIARHRHKGSELEDLRKARWYLDRAIARRTNGA